MMLRNRDWFTSTTCPTCKHTRTGLAGEITFWAFFLVGAFWFDDSPWWLIVLWLITALVLAALTNIVGEFVRDGELS